MKTKESSFIILKKLRDEHYKKSEYYLFAFIILLGILIIDVVSIFGSRNFQLNSFSWMGIFILIIALGFCMKDVIFERKEVETIDNFYIAKTYQAKINNEK